MALPAIALAGLAGSAISSGVGAFFSAREMKKQRAALAAAENRKRMNYLENTALLNQSKDWALRRVQAQNDKMNRGINSRAVSTGMTHENKLAAMQTAGDIYANAANEATADQTAKQLALKQNMDAEIDAIDQQKMGLNAQRSQMWANLGSNLAGSLTAYAAAAASSGNGQGNALANKPQGAGGTGLAGSVQKTVTPAAFGLNDSNRVTGITELGMWRPYGTILGRT
jgi:hypothetical protein